MWIGGGAPIAPLPPPSLPLPLPLLTGARGYNHRNFLKLNVLVGDFYIILGLKINTFMNQVFLSKTLEFQLNRLYKYTCWASDRNAPFPLGYRNMHDRI